jgi:hypothetical protein
MMKVQYRGKFLIDLRSSELKMVVHIIIRRLNDYFSKGEVYDHRFSAYENYQIAAECVVGLYKNKDYIDLFTKLDDAWRAVPHYMYHRTASMDTQEVIERLQDALPAFTSDAMAILHKRYGARPVRFERLKKLWAWLMKEVH